MANGPRHRVSRSVALGAAALLAALLAGCGVGSAAPSSRPGRPASHEAPVVTGGQPRLPPDRPPRTTVPSPTTRPPVTTVPPTTTRPPTTTTTSQTSTTAAPLPPSATAPTTTTSPAPPPPSPHPALLVTQLSSVDDAAQVVTVEAAGYGTTTATVDAFEKVAGRWQQDFGPIPAAIGYDGLAPYGQKREGDGRTPSGVFALGPMFGVLPNPGVRFPYQQVNPSDVWVDDPQSADYNLEEQLPDDGRWRPTVCIGSDGCYSGAEPMYNPTSYQYAAVIEYNVGPVVAGDGSAIFFHVSTPGQPTVGCVAIPIEALVSVLDWLQPSAHPVIVIGTSATITGF
jgi:L,D-peptidoglycan transpeptidase YkuD (ErfK/YbiS/YcfS/YnhG family)